MKLFLAVIHSNLVSTIDDPNETISRLEIVPPIRSNRLLSSDIPNVKFITLYHTQNSLHEILGNHKSQRIATFYARESLY